MQIIFLDIESTDVDENARLVQLAYKNAISGDMVNEYFNPPVPIAYGAMAVHHITSEMVAGKSAFDGSQYKNNLIKTLAGNVLIAHNAPFDIMILKNEGVEVGEYIDTLRVARHQIDSEQYKLQYLRYSLNLNVEGLSHDAMGDVVVLESLFGHLKTVVKNKFSLNSDDEIFQKMLELTKMPVLLNTIMFGKYRGKTFEEISENDIGYLEWLHGSESQKSESDQNEDLVYTLSNYIGSR